MLCSTYPVDYYQCTLHGFSGPNLGNCPYPPGSVELTTSGNTKLQPITADVWSAGAVWTPTRSMLISVDYLHWAITNEVTEQDSDAVLRIESPVPPGHL
jgi:iron complex outermembrane recepter protein